MLELPGLIKEELSKLLFDGEYFIHVMLNGGFVGLIGIPLFIFFIVMLINDAKEKDQTNSNQDKHVD